jgi:hypothetical protein
MEPRQGAIEPNRTHAPEWGQLPCFPLLTRNSCRSIAIKPKSVAPNAAPLHQPTKEFPPMSSSNQTSPHSLPPDASLTPDEHRIARMLALLFAPVSRTILSHCLRKAGMRSEQGKPFSSQMFTPLLESLIHKGVALMERSEFSCHAAARHHLVLQLEDEGTLAECAAAVRSTLTPPSYVNGFYYTSYHHFLQDLRIALYLRDEAGVERLLAGGAKPYADNYDRQPPPRHHLSRTSRRGVAPFAAARHPLPPALFLQRRRVPGREALGHLPRPGGVRHRHPGRAAMGRGLLLRPAPPARADG